jgi:hypothetical protein
MFKVHFHKHSAPVKTTEHPTREAAEAEANRWRGMYHCVEIVPPSEEKPRALRWSDVRKELKGLGLDASREDHGSGSYEYRVTWADLPAKRAEDVAALYGRPRGRARHGPAHVRSAERAGRAGHARGRGRQSHSRRSRALIDGGGSPEALQAALDHAVRALQTIGEMPPAPAQPPPNPVQSGPRAPRKRLEVQRF